MDLKVLLFRDTLFDNICIAKYPKRLSLRRVSEFWHILSLDGGNSTNT